LNKPLLSIVIPTYNREHLVLSLLERVCNFKKEWVEIVIIDNNSTSVDKLINQIRVNNWSVNLVRNKHNVGGNENILRCFEYANGDWIWAIGDDDVIENNCFEIIYDKILALSNSNVFGIHFNWDLKRQYKEADIYLHNLEELFKNMHSLGDINFMSSNIFRYNKINTYLVWVYYHQYNCNPMSSIIMLGLDKNMEFILTNDRIIQNGFYTNSNKKKTDFWDVEIVLKANSLLGELPLTDKNKKALIKLLLSYFTPWLAFKGAIREYIKGSSKRSSIWSYREMVKHQFVYGSLFKIFYILSFQSLLYILIKPLSAIYTKSNNK
jgi:glycosyltransferase involved in cell wall biosynthesis